MSLEQNVTTLRPVSTTSEEKSIFCFFIDLFALKIEASTEKSKKNQYNKPKIIFSTIVVETGFYRKRRPALSYMLFAMGAHTAMTRLRICTFCIMIVMGKSRVAPRKLVRVPRLELVATVLAVKLSSLIVGEFQFHLSAVYL